MCRMSELGWVGTLFLSSSFCSSVIAPPRLLTTRLAPYAAEAQVGGRGIDGLSLPRRRPVAQAVVGCAQVRAALDHLLRNLAWAAACNRAAGAALRRAHGPVLVDRPLPHVAGHVEEAVAVGRKGADG